jgi:hypothetical protein
MSDRLLRIRYQQQKSRASDRGILFLLTFEEWLSIWEKSGHLHERGVGKGQYVMARLGDKGPYATGNVKIITTGDNAREVAQTKELRRKKGAQAIGKPSNNRKLKDHEVLEIRATYKRYSKTHGAPALAAKYGVHYVTVWEALKGQGWQTV